MLPSRRRSTKEIELRPKEIEPGSCRSNSFQDNSCIRLTEELSRFCLTPNETQFEAFVVTPAIKGAATGKTGRAPPQPPGTPEIAPATGTGVKVAPLQPANREGQVVAARFIRDPEIGAGAAPFLPVRRDPAPSGAGLREEMRQLVAQGAIDLALAVRGQAAVENHARLVAFGATGRRAEPRRPFHAHLCCHRHRAMG